MSTEIAENEKKNNDDYYPVLPLRDAVIFPSTVIPLYIGRAKSVKSIELAVANEHSYVLLVTQNNPEIHSPSPEHLEKTSVLCNILQVLKLPDGTLHILVEGLYRTIIKKYKDTNACMYAYTEKCVEKNCDSDSREDNALINMALELFDQYCQFTKNMSECKPKSRTLGVVADTIITHVVLPINVKMQVLQMLDAKERIKKVITVVKNTIYELEIEKEIRDKFKLKVEQKQRAFYLVERLNTIKEELDQLDCGDNISEIKEFENKILKAKLPKAALDKALEELKRIQTASPSSAEASISHNYLDILLALPWHKRSKTKKNLAHVKNILDKNHYGMVKVKDRILEYVATQHKISKVQSTILCLYGPPGVGKTSLGKSIANAIGREFVRISLGGIRDEAEIRGHRKTYVGAMPGKILQAIKKTGTKNPVILLDEIDKMSHDYSGDPASALLEVLDPEQNAEFMDHYLEIGYDISEVIFIATSNTLNIPHALLDRLEILQLYGYTENEKLEIAKRHLVIKIKEEHGLKSKEFSIKTDAIVELIRYYTRESGVRALAQEIRKVARKSVRKLVEDTEIEKISITKSNLKEISGIQRYAFGEREQKNTVGAVTGLAYTEVGGELLTIESVLMHNSKGEIKYTGKLGDVMKESVQAAYSYIKSTCYKYSINPSFYNDCDIHLHIPEGAVPKDGPSAGIAISTSIVSLLTDIPINRFIAMTGEVTLRGNVLPIGGLKEKLLAAIRGSIKKVLIPTKNKKDLEELPAEINENLEIVLVSTVDEVISHALVAKPKAMKKETYYAMLDEYLIKKKQHG